MSFHTTKLHKFVSVAFALLLALTPLLLSASAAQAQGGTASYLVTIENLAPGQPISPPMVITHDAKYQLFQTDKQASTGIQQIAENGNNAPLRATLDTRRIVDFAEASAPLVPQANPGGTPFAHSVSLMVEANRDEPYLSLVGMLICTNDGFVGLNHVRLPLIGSAIFLANSYDAGTEINTEDFANIVPPCQALIGVGSDDPGTGETDPNLSENGVIHRHAGIVGGNDLVPTIHGWTDPVAKVTVTRVAPNATLGVADLSGAGEVPMVHTAATGRAGFNVMDDGSILYNLSVENMTGVVQAHVHSGGAAENGPVTVFLFRADAPTGPVNGQIASGKITEADLIGPFAGNMAGLIQALRDGKLYVNVHTTANPSGEIRGQIGVGSANQ